MHTIKLFLAMALCSLVTPALAAELTLFEAPGFGGRFVTLRGYTADLSQVGFNDRTSSLVVRSGTWQICTDAEFNGYCAKFTRGEYRTLDQRFNNRISSAREMGSHDGETGSYGHYDRGAIELFEARGFGGRSMRMDTDNDNFAGTDFNDRAASVLVHEGTWELCSDAHYRGNCRTYAPGRYADLGYGMSRQISSARLVGAVNELPAVIGGGLSGADRDRDDDRDDARVILYEAEGLRGRSLALAENMVDLARTDFNDRTVSLVIERGTWQFCTDAYFGGYCRILGPGQYRRLEHDLQRSISSIRFAGKAKNGADRSPRNDGEVVLFEYPDFIGKQLGTKTNIVDLADRNFNDRAKSLIVYSGQWQFCVDANYRGHCVVYGPGQYTGLYGMGDRISSLRRLH